MEPKYPQVNVELVGHDGNAFTILGTVLKAMRKAEISVEERNKFAAEAQTGDYDHLLQTCMRWVNVN